MYYCFPCGCSFRVIKDHPNPNIIPYLDYDVERDIDFDCRATWDLLGRGLTKGVFQLESQLGKQWTKRLKPEHIEHLAALGALLRPGCLRAIDDKHKCSLTELYCRRKNKEAEVEFLAECIANVLAPTYGVLTYQEQAMEIAKIIAGFNLQQADELRKAIGKKLAEEMAKVKVKYFDGAALTKVVSHEMAVEIFGWIEKSQRYSFNKSHAVSYGLNGYISAYQKQHFPVYFYTSWLYYAKDKGDPQQEVKELVNDAKLLDVQVLPPNINSLEANFATDGEVITFGLSDVKGIGESHIAKLNVAVDQVCNKLGKPLMNFSWYEILVHLSSHLSNTVATRLITVGAFRDFGTNRSQMLEEYNAWTGLTEKEQDWIRERSLSNFTYQTGTLFVEEEKRFDNILTALKAAAPVKKAGGAASTVKRAEVIRSLVQLLEKPATQVIDSPNWIAWQEENLLGIPLTYTRVDACDTSSSTCTCKEFLAGKTGDLVFAVEIQTMREFTVKNGKQTGRKMAFLTVADSSASVEMIAFPDALTEYNALLVQGNTVLVQAMRDKKKDSLVIKKVFQI